MDFQNGAGGEALEDEVERKAPPRRTNATLAIEELRLELLNNFGSNTIQKTEITVPIVNVPLYKINSQSINNSKIILYLLSEIKFTRYIEYKINIDVKTKP